MSSSQKKNWRAAVERATQPAPARNELSSSEIIKGTELFEWMTGGLSAAGVVVNEKSAMRVSAVYASVNLIAGAIASLPIKVYRRFSDGGREAVDSPIGDKVNKQPHADWTAAVFWEYLTGSLLLLGDAFAVIRREGATPVAIEPKHHSQVEVINQSGQRLYLLRDKTGRPSTVIHPDDIIHIPGPGYDGKNGMSQIRHALRNSAGISLAADEYSGQFFSNGARPDFAIEIPDGLTPEQVEQYRQSWADRYQGLAKSHQPALMTAGAKVHELTMNAEDAQLIATRQFQVEDIARAFGVPPHMIGHTQNTTSWGSGVEQMSIGFVKYTLQRHLVKIEQELNRKLFRGPGNEDLFCEFNTAGLERGDYKTRNEGYRIGLGRAGEPAWLTVNEVRKLENLPPIEGGDALYTGDQTNAATA